MHLSGLWTLSATAGVHGANPIGVHGTAQLTYESVAECADGHDLTCAQEQRVAAEKAAAEEAAAKEAEAKAVEAEAAAAGVAEESSEGEDWDAVDVDQLELPEQKAARLKVGISLHLSFQGKHSSAIA